MSRLVIIIAAIVRKLLIMYMWSRVGYGSNYFLKNDCNWFLRFATLCIFNYVSVWKSVQNHSPIAMLALGGRNVMTFAPAVGTRACLSWRN